MMRKVTGLAFFVLLAASARPAAGDATIDTGGRWVGTWSGKVTAKGCATDGATTVALDVAFTADRGFRSNGDLLVEGVGDLDWTAAGKGLAASRTGLSATLTPSGKGAKLALRTDGGCVVKGTLKRATSGIPACDTVRSLATMKAQCTALPSASRGDALAGVEADWTGWAKLKGKKKKAQAATCKAQVASLTDEVAACGGSTFTTGLPSCDEYIRMVEAYVRCDKVPQAARDGVRQGIDYMKSSWATISGGSDDVKAQTEEACRQAVDALRQGASALGCTL